MKALVIDDSSTMRLIISRVLKELGHETVQAANGREGLEAAKAADALGVIFVDWNMPEMNGYDFVVAARAESGLKLVPIIMVTTENEAPNVRKAIDAGANEFIMKPFTKDSIVAKLSQVRPA